MEVEKEDSKVEEKHSHRVITIDPSEGSRARKVILEKPTVEMTRHIEPLYVKAQFNGKPVSKVLVDNGSAINVMPLRMLRTLGKGIGDLIEIDVYVSAFIGEISKTLSVLPIDITIGSMISLSTFFVINSTINYNTLLGRDWINVNWCVSPPPPPLPLHQLLLFWKGDDGKLVWSNKQPFSETSYSVETSYYDKEFCLIKFKGNKKNKTLREIYMESRDTGDIKDQAAKLLKTTIIMAFRSIKGMIIKEIDY